MQLSMEELYHANGCMSMAIWQLAFEWWDCKCFRRGPQPLSRCSAPKRQWDLHAT